jgi:glycosyltransferase involved in cell wall biosynthesis
VQITLMVDALSPQLSGIGRYCWELAQRLPIEPGIDSVKYRCDGVWIEEPSKLLIEGKQKLRRRGKWMRRLLAPFDQSQIRQSIVHSPNYFLPTDVDSGVITVHDLSVFKFPETHPADRIKQFERDFQSSVNRAVKIITDTDAVRQELINYCNIPSERIRAIHLGFDPHFRVYSREETADILKQYQLEHGQYGLCVSTFEPRKKIAQLLSAWRNLSLKLRNRYPLAIVGAPGWLNGDLNIQIQRGVEEGWLKNLGFVAEPHLPLIYGGASVFVYPSIYEGFGLPPLEAMACGIPTIVADHSCAREICSDAAIYINPDDHAAFIDAIYISLEDGEARRQSIEKGLQRSHNYSWTKCVSETVNVYREIEKS